MKHRFRFAEDDREQFGGDWYEVDMAVLVDWNREGMTGLVERFEDETGYQLPFGLREALARGFHRPMRALAWWAVLCAGHDVSFDDFAPRLDLAEVENQGNRQGPSSRATPKPGTAGRSAAKRSASTSRTTS